MVNTSNHSKKSLGKLTGLFVVILGITFNTLGIVTRLKTEYETTGIVLILIGILLMVCGIVMLIRKASQNKSNISDDK